MWPAADWQHTEAATLPPSDSECEGDSDHDDHLLVKRGAAVHDQADVNVDIVIRGFVIRVIHSPHLQITLHYYMLIYITTDFWQTID